MPQEVPRIALVGTFEDEAEASIEVAQAMKDKLRGVRLDTPAERGGVTVEMTKEMRARLDQAGFNHVELMVTGDFDPETIGKFVELGAPVDTFGVGQYIAASTPNIFIADIHEVDGRPLARKGKIPGITSTPKLDRVM
jgi:nicotinate phosphoribosyltransferase